MSPDLDKRGRSSSRGAPDQQNLDKRGPSSSKAPAQKNISILPPNMDNKRSSLKEPSNHAQQNISRIPPNLDNIGRLLSRVPPIQPQGNFSIIPPNLDNANPAARTQFNNRSSSSSRNNQYSRMRSRLDNGSRSSSKNRTPSQQNQTSQIPSRLDNTQPPPARSQGVLLKSTFRSTRDAEMASRQTNFNSLSPVERQEQDKWARNQLHSNISGCPGGAAYIRSPKGYPDGYICASSVHLVTDELLKEGFGRFYVAIVGGGPKDWIGPFGSLAEVDQYNAQPMYMGGWMRYGSGRRR